MDTTALAEMLAQEIRRVDGSHSLGAAALAEALVPFVESLRAVAGEPVGYADGSRFHELREGRLNLALWAEKGAFADTPLYTRPQPATPATVTEEDVERITDVFLAHTGQAHKVTQLQRDLARPCMRAALESFANKEPTDE